MIMLQLLAAGAYVGIGFMIVGEVGARVGAVAASGFVEHRYVRLDAAFVDQSGEVLGRAVGGVGGEALSPDAEAKRPACDGTTCSGRDLDDSIEYPYEVRSIDSAVLTGLPGNLRKDPGDLAYASLGELQSRRRSLDKEPEDQA